MSRIAAIIAVLRAQYPQPPQPGPLRYLIGLIIVTVVLGAFFWLLETWWPERPQSGYRRPGWRTDLVYWFFDAIVVKRLVGLAIFFAVVVLTLFEVPRLHGWFTGHPIWLQGLEAILIGDFIFYWVHRTMHTVPFLWKFHAVHHSSPEVDWLAAARVHPLESVVTRLACVIPVYLLGFSPKVTAIYAPLLGFYPIYLHSNLKWNYGVLGRWITSPAFHRWHHSSDERAMNHNFAGLFAIFDQIFGTTWLPGRESPSRFGLARTRVPEGLLRQIAFPFRGRAS